MSKPTLTVALALGLFASPGTAWASPAPYRIATSYSSDLEKTLLVAAFKSDSEWVERLLAQGASANARFYGDAFSEEDALDFGVGMMEDFPAYVRLVQANDGRFTALMLATHAGNPAIVSMLLARQADPNKRCGKTKDTPLMVAVRSRQGAIARLLLEAGADPNLTNGEGETALDLAVRYGHMDVAELLVARGGVRAGRSARAEGPAGSRPPRSR